MTKIKFTIYFILIFLVSCGTSALRFQKTNKFNPNVKNVITMAVFDMSTNSVASSDDEVLKTFGSISQAKVGEIYGNLIPGGDLTVKAAETLGIKKELDTAMGKITEAIVNSNSLDPKTTEVFAKLAQYLKVDALAFPLASGGKANMENPGITFRFVLYDTKNAGIQYWAEVDAVSINALSLKAAPDEKAKTALYVASATKGINALYDGISAEIEKARNPK
ncbi:hypothetical protein [Leptospira levettii]|uniref:hypothetical protein n=1 Tax=Leptospira levettii TaxID=2023178 RepID=UPI00223E5C06|nr:hypothetical protein [Leptospira levettii]MCW7474574.1 hypothetical protein [Leptospira levettii]